MKRLSLDGYIHIGVEPDPPYMDKGVLFVGENIILNTRIYIGVDGWIPISQRETRLTSGRIGKHFLRIPGLLSPTPTAPKAYHLHYIGPEDPPLISAQPDYCYYFTARHRVHLENDWLN